MNKEEAIKAIQDFIGWFKPDSRIYKALKMAIQALSQELCEWGKMTFDAISGMSIFEFSDGTVKRVKQAELEPCEDAISRDAVIKIIEDAETARLRGDIDLLYAPILKKLNELTSVNPQPCDDAISREAVLNGLKGCICDEWVKTLFATMVKQLPSVTPTCEEREKGECPYYAG